MLNEEQFLKGMAALMAAYPDYSCMPGTVDVYRERLCANLTPQEWEYVVKFCIDTCKWFPKIAEIKEAILTLRNQGRPSAAERWGQLLDLASRGAPAPTDVPTQRALLAVGGWDAFQFTPTEEMAFRRKDFERTYADALAEEDRGAMLGLTGGEGQKRIEE